MGRSGWYGQSIKHSLAARGIRIRRKPLLQMGDVHGLEGLVRENCVPHVSDVQNADIRFYDWELVHDASGLGEKPKLKELMAAPVFTLGFAEDNRFGEVAYVFVGRGGTFVHPPNKANPRGWKDNYYMEPVAYQGPGVVFEQPVMLSAPASNDKGETVPFVIAGLVGLEQKVVRETAAKRNGHERVCSNLVRYNAKGV